MPLTLAFTDSLGYVNKASAETAGWAVTPGGGRVILSFNEPHTVDGEIASMLVTLNGWNVPGDATFSMVRSFEMAPNALCGASVAEDRVGAPWFEDLIIGITTSLGTHEHGAVNGMITHTTGGDGVATIYIKKSIGYPYVHNNERYYFANMRLYGTLIGELPPGGPSTEELPALLFTPEINWESPFFEELETETTFVTSHGQTEQREALMDTPNRHISFLTTPTDARESGLLEALIYGGQARQWWAPYWRSVQWLPVAKSAGATTLAFDTRFKGYEAGQGIMFWKDPFTAEVAVIDEVTDAGLVFSALTSSWVIAGVNKARIMPAFLSLMAPSVELDYQERSAKAATMSFDLLD